MSSLKILVVEDEDAIRGMLIMVLQQAGFLPTAAKDAEEAQNIIHDNPPG